MWNWSISSRTACCFSTLKMKITVENGQKISNIYAKYKNTVLKVIDSTTKQNSFYACGAGIDGQIGNGSVS